MKRLLQIAFTLALFTQVGNTQPWALNFDGGVNADTQSIKYSDDANTDMMDGATSYTIEAWVKPNTLIDNGKVLLSLRDSFRITFWSNNRFYFTQKDGGVNEFFNSTDNALTPDVWQHIAVICDENDGANGSVKLYVNGVEVTASSYEAKALVGGATNNDIFIGYGGGGYPNMQAREIRIKNNAEAIGSLNTSNVASDYASDSNTAALFHFSEGSGLVTENAASGTNAVFGFSGAHYPTWVDLSGVLSINKNQTTSFRLFPNPANDSHFTIQANNNESIQDIELFDLLGKSVRKMAFGKNTLFTQISTENLTSGMYIVKIKTDVGIGTQKVLIN